MRKMWRKVTSVLCIAAIAVGLINEIPTASAFGSTGKVNYLGSTENNFLGGTVTGIYTVTDGNTERTAYCVQPKVTGAGNGQTTSNTDYRTDPLLSSSQKTMMAKALWYGYEGKNTAEFNEFYNSFASGSTYQNYGYSMMHRILSEIYGGNGLRNGYTDGADYAFYKWLETAPAIPYSPDFTITNGNVTSTTVSGGVNKSATYTFKPADSNLTAGFSVPSGLTCYVDGKKYAAGSVVALKSGNSFYFTASVSVTINTSVTVKGAEAPGGYIARQSGEVQDLFVADGFSSKSVTIKMNFKATDNGIIIVNKKAEDEAGSRYLAGAEFNLYYRESTTPANAPNLTITTSDDCMSRSVVMGADTQLIATFKVAESGQMIPTAKTITRNGSTYTPAVQGSALTKLPVGAYTLVEVKAPDNGLYRVTEKEGSDAFISASTKGSITIEVEDPVVNDPLSITITKSNDEGNGASDGNLSLAGTVFEISHYEYTLNGRYYSSEEELEGKTADSVWYVETEEFEDSGEYNCKLSEKFLLESFNGIKSSELPEGGKLTCGTLVIKEVKAAEGFVLDSGNVTDKDGQTYDKNVYIGHIKPDAESESGASLYDISEERCFENNLALDVTNAPVRGDFAFKKVSADNESAMADVEFELILLGKDENGNETETENHTIKTGTDGTYSSAEDDSLWFTGTGSEKTDNADQSKGSLVYGTYILREKRCAANASYTMAGDIRFEINEENENINLGEILNYPHPYIHTKERDDETKDHISMADERVTVKDTVSYFNLPSDSVFTVKGILMEKSSDGTVKVLTDKYGNVITAVKTFTTESGMNGISSGSLEMSFCFDGSDMAGKTFVIYEYLYAGESSEAIRVTDGMLLTGDIYKDADGNEVYHADSSDENQTGYFPEGETTALGKESGDHTVAPQKEVSIVDTVTYKNLIPGKEYTVKGTLMDKESGSAVKDADGNEITGMVSFVPEEKNGKVEVVFTFDSSELAGKELVVFEEMYLNGVKVFTHTDLEDEGQTVRVKQKNPPFISEKIPPVITEKVPDSVKETGDEVGDYIKLAGLAIMFMILVVMQRKRERKEIKVDN